MATAVKQKKTFKESMQETGSKVKAYGQKKYECQLRISLQNPLPARTSFDRKP